METYKTKESAIIYEYDGMLWRGVFCVTDYKSDEDYVRKIVKVPIQANPAPEMSIFSHTDDMNEYYKKDEDMITSAMENRVDYIFTDVKERFSHLDTPTCQYVKGTENTKDSFILKMNYRDQKITAVFMFSAAEWINSDQPATDFILKSCNEKTAKLMVNNEAQLAFDEDDKKFLTDVMYGYLSSMALPDLLPCDSVYVS